MSSTQTVAPVMKIGLSIRSDVSAISPAVDRLMVLLRRADCIPGDERDVELALREALANAVIHGNREDAIKRVHIRCCCQAGGGVVVVVEDEGRGFDAAQLPNPLTAENILSEHGRGVFLMKQFMDEVQYRRGGAEVYMRKGSIGLQWKRQTQQSPFHAAA